MQQDNNALDGGGVSFSGAERRSFAPHTHVPVTGGQAALDALLAYLRSELETKSAYFFDRAERGLHHASLAIGDPISQARSRAALQWLTDHRRAFSRELGRRQTQALTTPGGARKPDYGDLTLLDEDALGVNLARASLVDQVTQRGALEVASLEARLYVLYYSGLTVVPEALSPGRMADGFLNVLNEIGAPREVQKQLLEVYGERGVEVLIKLYQGANSVLQKHGIHPQFKRAATAHPQTRITHAGTSPQGALQKHDVLRELVGGVVLSDWRPGLLRQLFADTSPLVLSVVEQQAIDQIEALFLDLLRDQRISTRIRHELSRLILPVMTLQLGNPEAFAKYDNPARTLVRQLAMLGYRDEEILLHEFESIKLVVSRIVAEQGRDLNTFHSGSQALYTLARREVKRRQTMHQALQGDLVLNARDNSLERRIAAEDPRRHVILELHEHAAGLRLPQVVQQFIVRALGPWMVGRYQRYGEGSPPWNEARMFATVFFDLLRPAVNQAELERKRSARLFTIEQARIRTARSEELTPEERQELLAGLENYFVALARHEPTSAPLPMLQGTEFDAGFLEAITA